MGRRTGHWIGFEQLESRLLLASNQIPVVDAGPDVSLPLSAAAQLEGTVSDDGPLSSISVAWVKVRGPGEAIFSEPSAVQTAVQFSQPGHYDLRLEANDGHYTSTDYTRITVLPNRAPLVDAGPDQTAAFSTPVALDGTVTGDGAVTSLVAVSTWTAISGPSLVSFANPSSVDTRAHFTSPGTYVLQLAAGYGELVAHDQVVVTVLPTNVAPTVAAGEDQQVLLPAGAGSGEPLAASPQLTQFAASVIDFSSQWSSSSWSAAQALGPPDVHAFADDPQAWAPRAKNGGSEFLTLGFGTPVFADGVTIWENWGNGFVTQVEVRDASSGAFTPVFAGADASAPGSVVDFKVDFPLTERMVDAVRLTINTDHSELWEEIDAVQLHGVTVLPAVGAPASSADRVEIALDGTVSDDGLPSPPGGLNTLWRKLSGPGDVVFADPATVDTLAFIASPGTYLLQLEAFDGEYTASDQTTITVIAVPDVPDVQNRAPQVIAGADQSGLVAVPLDLIGRVTDDGLPNPPDAVVVSWTQVSGPGEIRFSDATSQQTAATFERPGTYVLRLSAFDGELTASDELTVTVSPPHNDAPTVDAGPDIDVSLDGAVSLEETTTEGGFPVTQFATSVINFSSQWSGGDWSAAQALGPPDVSVFADDSKAWAPLSKDGGSEFLTVGFATAVFANRVTIRQSWGNGFVRQVEVRDAASGAFTPVFSGVDPSVPGSVVDFNVSFPLTEYLVDAVRLTIDTDHSALWEEVDAVQLHGVTGAPAAGEPWSAAAAGPLGPTGPAEVALDGTANDDGLPTPPGDLTTLWRKLSGPGEVSFADPADVDTVVRIATPGSYLLQLEAFDGEFTATDDLTVTVSVAHNDAPAVDAGPDTSVLLGGTVLLAGTISDDGQPQFPGVLTAKWTTLGGPGTVTFADPASTVTSASFSAAGTYVLRLEADDGERTTSDEVIVRVLRPPTVDEPIAAPRVTAPVIVDGELSETFWDDAPWLTFSNPSRSENQVTVRTVWDLEHLYFAYEVRDSSLEAVNAAVYQDDGAELFLDVGHERSDTLDGNDYHLMANIDGRTNQAGASTQTQLKDGAYVMEIALAWQELGAVPVPGESLGLLLANNDRDAGAAVQFDHLSLVETGSYARPSLWGELTLIAADTVANQAPQVDAGPDDSVLVTAVLDLQGTFSDDGLPQPPQNVTASWSKVSGPGTVTFADAAAADTAVTFSATGDYVLRLEAHDGELTASDEVAITVNPEPLVLPPVTDDLIAMRTTLPLTLDGDLTEVFWHNAQALNFSNSSRSDNQVTVKAAWDHQHLYFAYEVQDAVLEAAGNLLYADDGAELFVDVGYERGQNLDSNDFHLFVTIDGNTNQPGVESEFRTTQTGYVLEMAIPWAALQGSPVAGDKMGLLLANNDRDNDSTVQFDHLGLIETGSYSRPHLWAELTLHDSQPHLNLPPTVIVSAADSVPVSAVLNLDGTVVDDGLPNPSHTVVTTWSKVSGPGTVTFDDSQAIDTTAVFSDPGSYTIRLEAHDGSLTGSDELIVSVTAATFTDALAFPGAEGFGAKSIGGRGGTVIEVTNLNDSGPGSFRAAVEAQGPRIVVFRTGGTIELNSPLHIRNPFLTIAGQTAPGGGITLKNGASQESPIQIWTNDIVIRYLRVRPGPGGSPDAIEMLRGAKNVIIDHVSASWAVDEIMSTWYDANNITIQWSIISEGLYNSTHRDPGPHSMGVLLGHAESHNISLHHNLLAHNDERNPRIISPGPVDVVNNVVYNPGDTGSWGPSHASYVSGQPPQVNYVGNYFKAGPNTGSSEAFLISGGGQFFVQGNITPGRPSDDLSQSEGVVSPNSLGSLVSQRHATPPITTTSAFAARDAVLASAGANIGLDAEGKSFGRRDAVDKRVVDHVLQGVGAIIDDPSEVGGWPQLAAGVAPQDTDRDGMPDDWERLYGLDPSNPADGARDADVDGYTNVEEYLNRTLPLIRYQ